VTIVELITTEPAADGLIGPTEYKERLRLLGSEAASDPPENDRISKL
jgi:hypothetical protein